MRGDTNFKGSDSSDPTVYSLYSGLNTVFLSWAKNTTRWLYVTLTGHITITIFSGKNESLRSEPKHMVLVFDDFVPKLLFPSWCYRFLLERILVERVNSADQINLVVTCTAACKCHHLIKNIKFLSEMWHLKQIKDLAIANIARFASLNAVFLSWAKNVKFWDVAIANSLTQSNLHDVQFESIWLFYKRLHIYKRL